MSSKLTINLVGSGNVATFLGVNLLSKGHCIASVYSPQIDHATELAEKTNTVAVNSITELPPSDVIIIAVNDQAIGEIALQLTSRKDIVVHTSGNIPMDVLSNCKNYGVLYPFQTITKVLTDSNFPILIEANNEQNTIAVESLAGSLSKQVFRMSSNQRKHLHLAAVFVNNFGNHLNTIALSICKENGINPSLLVPLAEKTAENFLSANQLQTGPAIRKDATTIENHLKLLQKSPEIADIYTLLTRHIQNSAHESEL